VAIEALMPLEVYEQLAQALNTGAAVLATVIHSNGSVPREVGAKLVVCANGQVWQTIGGGAGEAKVIQQARNVLATGQKQIVEIDLSGAPQRETQGVCGGMMQVWLERWEGQTAIARIAQILRTLKSGQSVTLVTPLSPNQSPYLLPPNRPTPENAFVEVLQPPPTLLIVGAGHCGRQLAKVAHFLGFQIVVQDDRAEWANPENYPQARMILTDAIPEAITQLTQHTQLYAALLTRGYEYDLGALKALLSRESPCRYIGMIGSEKRVRQVYQAIAAAGIFQAQLQSIYAPIGLDIGALTPEEIAVSIAAELILVRRGGTGRPLSDRRRSG
jgi:xanthine dehydrogenase accessory factor